MHSTCVRLAQCLVSGTGLVQGCRLASEQRVWDRRWERVHHELGGGGGVGFFKPRGGGQVLQQSLKGQDFKVSKSRGF